MNKRNVWFWTSPIIFGVLVMSIIRLVNDVPKNFKFWERSLYLNLIEILSVIIIFYVIQLSLLQYIKRQKAKEAQLTLKKLISEYLFITLSGMVIAIPSIYFVHLLTGEPVYLEDLVIAEIVSILLIT